MRYEASVLFGFLLTLVVSILLPQLSHLREVQALSMKAKNNWVGMGHRRGQTLEVEVAPLSEVSLDVREPRIKFMPQYPVDAASRQIEGYVTLSFQVNRDGLVRNLKVVDSYPPAVFDRAARRAISRWVYASSSRQGTEEPEEQRLKLVFNLKKNFAAQ